MKGSVNCSTVVKQNNKENDRPVINNLQKTTKQQNYWTENENETLKRLRPSPEKSFQLTNIKINTHNNTNEIGIQSLGFDWIWGGREEGRGGKGERCNAFQLA